MSSIPQDIMGRKSETSSLTRRDSTSMSAIHSIDGIQAVGNIFWMSSICINVLSGYSSKTCEKVKFQALQIVRFPSEFLILVSRKIRDKLLARSHLSPALSNHIYYLYSLYLPLF
jgi:hypothetical protein